MARTYEGIDERWAAWIAEQHLFFVATAPLAGDGHVNLSPKGPIGTLRVLGPHEVAFLDVVGSGAETIAHLRENGRIALMLCAFEGPPRILRLHGEGTVHLPGDPRYAELLERCAFDEPTAPEARRAIVTVAVRRVADACGYGVPVMRFDELRPHADLWAERKLGTGGPAAIDAYRAEKNAVSIDGLPALP
jgi:Pyridoxamine 5'-phosphate oxidase